MQYNNGAHIVEKVITTLSRIMGIIAIIFMLAMMLLTVADVFSRKFFHSPVPGSLELIEVMMIFTGFLGLGWCAMTGKHIKVDLIVGSMPRKMQAIIDSLTYLLGLCTGIMLSWRAVIESFAIRDAQIASTFLKIPLFPFYLVVSTGFAVLCLSMVVLIAKSLIDVVKR